MSIRQNLEVKYQAISALRPYPRNARAHTKRKIRQIADSMRTFGFTRPILVDRNNQIVVGNGALAAAKLLGIELIPTIRLEDMDEDQIRAYRIADNQLATLANLGPRDSGNRATAPSESGKS